MSHAAPAALTALFLSISTLPLEEATGAVTDVIIDEPPSDHVKVFRGGEVVSIVGTVAPAGLVEYRIGIDDSSGTPLSDPAIDLVARGRQAALGDVLGTWDTSGVDADHYTITVEAELAGGATISQSVRVVVDPTLHEGWPIRLDPNDSRSIVDHLHLADVTGDGRPEIIVGYGKSVQVFDHAAELVAGWPRSVDLDEDGARIQKSPVVSDIDSDGKVEVLASNNQGEIFVWRADGNPVPGWPRFVGGSLNSLVAVDMNGDGRNDIVAADWQGRVKVYDHLGRSLPGWPRTLDTGSTSKVLGRPSIGDVDADGRPEVVVFSSLGTPSNIHVLRHDGTSLPGWPLPINAMASERSALGDLDSDGDLEILVGASDQRLLAFHRDGSVVAGWPQATPAWVNSPTVGDIDGDGRIEVVAGIRAVDDGRDSDCVHASRGTGDYAGATILTSGSGNSNYLYAWRANGTRMKGWPVARTGVSNSFFGFGIAALADLDGDGAAEVIVSSDVGTRPFSLIAYHGDGTLVHGFPKPTVGLGAGESNTAAVGDLDGDGLLELAWVDLEKTLYVWDLADPAVALSPRRVFHRYAVHSHAVRCPDGASDIPD